ncbi:reverse transcriptase domain-containing protein [Tanacetum coccineum]
MFRKEYIRIESSTQHSFANDFVVINIPEEDVETKQIILDPDDQPMWESAKTVAPTPNSIIVQLDVDNNFVINSTHLNMIRENKFDGYLQADDHIREILAICDMFKYGETQSEAAKLLIFPYSLFDKAKTWFNELNEESITSWEQMRRAFISRFFPPSLFNRLLLEIRRSINQIFYHGLDESTQAILDVTAGGIFLYKSPNQAFQFLDDKVLFKLDWSTKSQNEHHQKSVAFANGSDSNDDNYRLMEKLEALTTKIDSKFQSLKEEMNEMRKNYNNRGGDYASKNDDTPMYERHEHENCSWKLFARDDGKTTGVLPNKESKTVNQEPQSKIDLEKSITNFLDGQRVTNMFFKNSVNDMILKMKQNEKNFQTKIKNMERKIDEWSKSQNVSLKQTDRTNPPPPQAQTEHVNAIFTGSGKSDDYPKIQKYPPPSIIVNNKTKKDKPIKTSERGYYVVETKEYPFREYILKIPYP